MSATPQGDIRREPIFIVGVQRSGTTLLAAMLAAHSRISCGPETHFFRKLALADVETLINPRSWPAPATDFICAIGSTGFAGNEQTLLVQKYDLERADVERYLAQAPPSVASMLAALTVPYMRRRGKLRWAEKTPDHLQHLAWIRESFPHAPIVNIVRDPRDVALSLGKVPWGVKSFTEGLLYWERAHAAGVQFLADDALSYSLRFEDLLTAPRDTLSRLCAFLGEEFEPEMLDTSATGREVNSEGAPWKRKASEPIDTARMYTWRKELTTPQNQLAEALVGNWLDAYNYPRDASFSRLGKIYPTTASIAEYAGALESIAGAGVRFWEEQPGEHATAQVYLGDPGNATWLSAGKPARLRDTLAISGKILRTSLAGERVYWAPDADGVRWTGYLAEVLKRILTSRGIKLNRENGGPNHANATA